jgi:transcriptional regulator with XRE-family HTH domain
MTQNNKARRVSSPLIKKILAEANPLHKLQNKNRIALACRIDDLIKSKGYNYSSFAKKLDKQPSVITKWLSGTHNFTMDTLDEISYCLGVDTAYLMQPQKVQVVYQKSVEIVVPIVFPKNKDIHSFQSNNSFNLWNFEHTVGLPHTSLTAQS